MVSRSPLTMVLISHLPIINGNNKIPIALAVDGLSKKQNLSRVRTCSLSTVIRGCHIRKMLNVIRAIFPDIASLSETENYHDCR